MEKELAQGNIGAIGKYDLSVHGGDVIATVGASAGHASIDLTIKLEGKSVILAGLEWLKQKIPGKLDDIAIQILEEKIKNL